MPVELPTSSHSDQFEVPRLKVSAGSWSARGPNRDNNEDCEYIAPTLDLFVVADGMGGHQKGELASRFAIDALTHSLAGIHEHEHTDEAIKASVHAALKHAHCMVLDLADPDEVGGQPGTTLVFALLFGERLFVTGIGDSRAYLLRNSTLERLTHDDTIVELLQKMGQITDEEARHHPSRNQLLAAVGVEGFSANTDIRVINIRPGDRLLLCSDGLSDVLNDDQIRLALEKKLNPRQAARELVEQAISAGARDDVTCIVMQVIDVPARAKPQSEVGGFFGRIRALFSPTVSPEPA